MKKIYENDEFNLFETGHDYDFVAVIENKTDNVLNIDEDEEETITIDPNNWIGLFETEYLKLKKKLGISSYYQIKQNQLRNEAIEWQLDYMNHSFYWSELLEMQNYFYKLGKRYGLLREFKENGIL